MLAEGLEISAANMVRNLRMSEGQIMRENVMMQLGRRIGHEGAHDLLWRCALRFRAEGGSFTDILRSEPELARHMDAAQASALDWSDYLGESAAIVGAVLAAVGHQA